MKKNEKLQSFENEIIRKTDKFNNKFLAIIYPVRYRIALILLLHILLISTFFIPIKIKNFSYYADIPNIRRPFKEEIVKFEYLMILTMIPAFVFIVNCFLYYFNKTEYLLINEFTDYFLFLVAKTFLVNFLKFLIERPRPDFYYRCNPNPISNECTGPKKLLISGLISFPSGHTSVAFMFFLFFIFHSLKYYRNFYIRFTACLSIIFAFLIGISRYYDNKHHVEDIVFGGIIGCLFFLLFYFYNYYKKNY